MKRFSVKTNNATHNMNNTLTDTLERAALAATIGVDPKSESRGFDSWLRVNSTSPLNRDLRPFGAHRHSLTEKWISRAKLHFRCELNYGLPERL